MQDEWLEIDGSLIISHSNNPNPSQPLLSQLERHSSPTKERIRACLATFGQMRFFSFSPEAMRGFSLPRQTVLDDKGENLSSVLQHLCSEPTNKHIFLMGLRELTPMNVQDIEFFELPDGRILLTLVEENGHRTTAYTASDGTLRFLAIMAALFEPARFHFFEELENGLYAPRMYLLLDLIERQTAQNAVQVVASTHSAHLLNLASASTLESASFIYRLEEQPSAHIKRIYDLPHARRVMAKPNIARLHAAGWLDHAVFFMDEEEESQE